VIAPARTGRDRVINRAVIAIDHTNSGIRSGFIHFGFMLNVVVIKFTAPRIEDTPSKCREKMARSTDAPVCAIPLARRGQTVHPVPTPLSTVPLVSKRVNDRGSNQNLMLFIRENSISGAPNIGDTNQFPNPPIGINIKKIMTNAWAVTMT
jgi:hypothetical protein